MNKTRVKVLLVDDIEDNLAVLKAILQPQDDLDLILARSGKEALESLLVDDIALALIDVHMPEMDGFELAGLMRGAEKTRQIPIVFVTAASRDQQRIFDGYAAGAVDFVFKPFEPHILQSKVDVFVELHRQKLRAVEQLAELREMLRMAELLTAAIGHDLRNPLNSIVGGAAVIAHSSKEEQSLKAAQTILSSGRRMAKLIAELLDFSSIRINGSLPMVPAEISLLELVKRVIAEHRSADPLAEIELRVTGDQRVCWDESRIVQMLSNLIGNALSHGDRSTPVSLVVEGTQPDSVTISVHNKGSIAPEVLPYVFDPFRSSSNRNSGASGLGLGLYIVEQIVKGHHGRLWVESTADLGTRFTMWLPRICDTTDSAMQRTVNA